MTNSVVFRTPTVLDISAFTMFGVSAKPNSNNPIGYFGTGLKYAIAVLMRHGISVSVFVEYTEYVFYVKDDVFRGEAFQQIMMKKRHGMLSRWSYTKLPFTTKLGKNWALWQVLRELQSNTLDENGISYRTTEKHDGPAAVPGEDGFTKIVVCGDAFLDAYSKIDDIFLPGAHSPNVPWDGSTKVEIRNFPSSYIYYRGLRVLDLREEERSNLTYNILTPIDLTEDRTIKYNFQAQRAICDELAVCEDEQILRVYSTADEDTWEGKLDWDWASRPMGPRLLAALRRYKNKSVRGFVWSGRYDAPMVSARSWVDDLEDAVRRADSDECLRVLAQNSTEVFRRLRNA